MSPLRRERALAFRPPEGWTRLRVLDGHAAGEPLRVVLDGFPEPPGATMLARRRWAQERCEPLRRALMLEPRGHADMYGAVPTAPATPDGDLGVLFLHNAGYSTMCGHGVIALVSMGLTSGLLEPPAGAGPDDEACFRLDTPAGRVVAVAERERGAVRRVRFRNVPSFTLALDVEVEVAGIGRLRVDVAFGGAFYAFARAEDLGLALEPSETPRILALGDAITRAVAAAAPPRHPAGEPDLDFLYGTILTRELTGPARSRHACVFADRELDRSPTGTGVSARLALWRARGEVGPGEAAVVESLTGGRFEVRDAGEADVAGVPAVVPEVAGTAHLTGRAELWVDLANRRGEGYFLR